MKMNRSYRKILIVLALAALSVSAFTLARQARAKGDKNPPTAIRVTPPPPVIDNNARLAELAERRRRVAEKIGPKAMLVLFSAEPRVYTNDVDYEYRQENNLYYLTNLKQKDAKLVLMPGNALLPEVLFLPRRVPAQETWTGHMYSPQEARQLSGVHEIWDASEFEPFMAALRTRQPYHPKAENLFMQATPVGNAAPVTPPVPQSAQTTAAATAATPARPVTGQSPANLTTTNPSSTTPSASAAQPAAASPTQQGQLSGFEILYRAMGAGEADLYLLIPREDDSREYKQEQNFAAKWAKAAFGFNVRNAFPLFTQMRLYKSPMELTLLQHAIDISIEAHERAQAIAGSAQWEYEVDGEVAYTYKRRNADHWGYPSIVGCGPNATTLHYEESQSRVVPGQLLLMDVGAEYDHYTADITRTFPVNGKFTPEQAAVYQIVYDAQEAGARAIKPSATLLDVHNAATEVIKDGLLKLGLITDKNSNQYRIWFMHGTSHWLGMNVHDVGTRDTKLTAGVVFTNEPGIYIREDALDYLPKTPETEKFIADIRPAFEKYKGIGVRIEDDMLVTPDGYKWMSESLPRSIKDIEAFIARARKEMHVSRVDRTWLDRNAKQQTALAYNAQGRLQFTGF